jgi:hypothetical protein
LEITVGSNKEWLGGFGLILSVVGLASAVYSVYMFRETIAQRAAGSSDVLAAITFVVCEVIAFPAAFVARNTGPGKVGAIIAGLSLVLIAFGYFLLFWQIIPGVRGIR